MVHKLRDTLQALATSLADLGVRGDVEIRVPKSGYDKLCDDMGGYRGDGAASIRLFVPAGEINILPAGGSRAAATSNLEGRKRTGERMPDLDMKTATQVATEQMHREQQSNLEGLAAREAQSGVPRDYDAATQAEAERLISSMSEDAHKERVSVSHRPNAAIRNAGRQMAGAGIGQAVGSFNSTGLAQGGTQSPRTFTRDEVLMALGALLCDLKYPAGGETMALAIMKRLESFAGVRIGV